MLLTPLPIHNPPGFPEEQIWSRLDPSVPFKGSWYEFRHRQQGEFLHKLAKLATFDVGLSHIGLSDEGRVLHTLRFGTGKRRVLVWARQHGDEPDCTAALSMALWELILRCEEPQYAFILQRLELGILPMVNPDGVTRFTRRSAQNIDINRDAVALSSPESRALMAIKDSLKPEFCFNLHDMNPRKSTEGQHLVAIAFQAGPFEPRDIDNEVRLKAKKICGIMADTARSKAPTNVARYAADYMHRAFGDTMMRLGVSSILIEAGGAREEEGGDVFVQRLFALSFLRGLYAIAAGEDKPPTGEAYDTIPFDSYTLFNDIVLEKGTILNGSGNAPIKADMAINVKPVVGRPSEPIVTSGTIDNIGDLADELAKKRVDVGGCMILPGFVAVSPQARFESDVPTRENAADFLRAGITTLACGFGPFENDSERESWMGAVSHEPPPLNIIAFERIHSIEVLRRRHGMSEMAGLLVPNLRVSAADLLTFMHLFHPAHPSAIEDIHDDEMVGIDLFFQGSSSPATSHMHLHISPTPDLAKSEVIEAEELRQLVQEFLRSPSQITLGMDAFDKRLDWLPFMMGFGGLSNGRTPQTNFFGNILSSFGARDSSGLVGALNMLTLNNARAFRLGNIGRLGIGQRADLVVFEEAILQGGEAAFSASPRMVVLQGEVVLDGDHQTSGSGSWHFASAPQVR